MSGVHSKFSMDSRNLLLYGLKFIGSYLVSSLSFETDSYKSHEQQLVIFTPLKNKIENNSAWEAAFYQSDWVKINWSSDFLIFLF